MKLELEITHLQFESKAILGREGTCNFVKLHRK